MLKKIIIILNLTPMILSLVILGAILLWAPVCQGRLVLANGMETHMKCFYMSRAGILIALILLVVSLENLIMNRKAVFSYLVIGIALLILPGASCLGIGVCIKEIMVCRTTAVWLQGGGILTIISGIASFLSRGKYTVS